MLETFGGRLCFLVLIFTLLFSDHRQANAKPSQEELLSTEKWQSIDAATQLALEWLISEQQPDGSFPTLPNGQPGVSSLCVLAFASHGHLPGEGPYGEQLQKAQDFIISCQKPNGLLAQAMPVDAQLSRNAPHLLGSAAAYNHAISALVLSELYAMSGGKRKQSQRTIENAVKTTLDMQQWPKPHQEDRGGWRYIHRMASNVDSDLSVSGWQLMFLRSAKNAGFDVPKERIDEAVEYISRCYHKKLKTFVLFSYSRDHRSRGMAGAGILALAHAGKHKTEEARAAGDWLLQEGFPVYNESRRYNTRQWVDDRYHYGVFLACQAMHQMGGDNWKTFYPPTIQVVLDNQDENGAWANENHGYDTRFGNAYTTALMTLTLGTPNELLPIFQR